MRAAQPTKRALARENEELRARLAEAEETLRLIRSGEVDALLASGAGGPIFTLEGAEQPYRILIETINEGAITLSSTGAILYSNRRFADLVGASLDQTIGAALESFVAPADRPAFEALLAQACQSCCSGEIMLQTRQGQLAPVLLSGRQLELDALPGACMVVTDISQHKRVEQELRRSNVELEQYMYVASHDLQEPLRMVSSYVQLLERRYKGRLDDNADTYIAYAVDGAARMQRLIQDLLAYSRVGSQKRAHAPADSGAAVAQAVANLHVAIEESGAQISHGGLPSVPVDAGQLAQVFQNLIGNAIKYRSQAAPLIQIAADQREDEWVFSVQDNGIGIEPQYAERIFIIFQRLHTRQEYPGTGIGLAICKKIVECHGGRIWLEAAGGQGARFCFALPSR